MVRAKGVEPSRPKAPEPKSGASTNSATRASKKTSQILTFWVLQLHLGSVLCYFLCYFYSVKPTAISSNKKQTPISPPSQGAHNYQKVYDGRKRRVRGLWKRGDTFYAQLCI